MSTQLETIFLRLAPVDIALVKFLFESYEEVGVIRTMDRHQAIIVALVCADFCDVARDIIRSLSETITLEEIPPPPDAGEDWLMSFLWAERGEE